MYTPEILSIALTHLTTLTVGRILIWRICRTYRFAIQFCVQCLINWTVCIVHVRIMIFGGRRWRWSNLIWTSRRAATPWPYTRITIRASSYAVGGMFDRECGATIRATIAIVTTPPGLCSASCKESGDNSLNAKFIPSFIPIFLGIFWNNMHKWKFIWTLRLE